MREIIVHNNPGMVSLNDQAHVTNLPLKDLSKVLHIAKEILSSVDISGYVKGHMYVLALYCSTKNKFKQTLKQQKVNSTNRTVNFTSPCDTRFCHALDGMERGAKYRKVCDMVDEKTALASKVSLKTESAKDALARFVEIFDRCSTWEEMEDCTAFLTYARAYLRP